ncbi:hypothetical protein [Polaromonas sp.]|uniref:hypothetical protein n=1 Tax=Polaromonas sp. TaxID=1869339 RepID=UPI00286BE673|nr:hypothetical protein [Polaromonas sp.]
MTTQQPPQCIARRHLPQAAYNERQARADSLLRRLSQALEHHASAAIAKPDMWGFAGDLAAVNEKLMEVLGTLGALTDDERANHRV